MTAKFFRISLNYKALSFDDFFYGWQYLFYSASHLLVWVTPCFQRKDWVWIRVYPLLLQVHCSDRYITIILLIIYLFLRGDHKICKKFDLCGFFLFFWGAIKMFIMAINTGYNFCVLYFLLPESDCKWKPKSDLCENNWI